MILRAGLGEAAHQPFQQPRAERVEILDPGHVEIDALTDLPCATAPSIRLPGRRRAARSTSPPPQGAGGRPGPCFEARVRRSKPRSCEVLQRPRGPRARIAWAPLRTAIPYRHTDHKCRACRVFRWLPNREPITFYHGQRVAIETWPIAGTFTISRGSKTQAEVVVVELSRRQASRPRRMRALSTVSVRPPPGFWRPFDAAREPLAARARSRRPATALPAGAARNGAGLRAVGSCGETQQPPGARVGRAAGAADRSDCLHDFARRPGHHGGCRPRGSAAAPQDQARRGRRPRPHRARSGTRAPDAELIVDANEGWSPRKSWQKISRLARDAGVTLVEQPLPATDDAALAEVVHPIPVCADESVHDRATLAAAQRQIRGSQYQARQGRRADRGAGARRGGHPAGVYDHGRLHGVDIARDRAGDRCSRNAPASSTSMDRSCWPRTGRTGCATTEARSTRPTRPCGGEGSATGPAARGRSNTPRSRPRTRRPPRAPCGDRPDRRRRETDCRKTPSRN